MRNYKIKINFEKEIEAENLGQVEIKVKELIESIPDHKAFLYEILKIEEERLGSWNVNKEMHKEMKQDRKNGKSMEWIARKFGLSMSTVRYHLDKKTRDKIKVIGRINSKKRRDGNRN